MPGNYNPGFSFVIIVGFSGLKVRSSIARAIAVDEHLTFPTLRESTDGPGPSADVTRLHI